MKNYICIDIGGTELKHALASDEGALSTFQSTATPQNLDSFVASIKKIQQSYASEPTQGIAISMPGLVNPATGHVIHGGALTYIQELNVRELLKEACGVPVQIENDGKAAALGEHWLGNLRGIQTGIALVIGTGIGGGIIIQNKLLHGHHLGAGEFSYMRTTSESENFQDLFAVQGSAKVLKQTYAKLIGVDDSLMNGKLFFADVNAGHKEAVALLDQYTEKLATQLLNLQTILDPEIITIGGGISQQTILFERINYHLDRKIKAFPLPLIRPTVLQSTLGNRANLLGALVNFKEQASL